VPYRVDLRNRGADAFDRLVELGALDAEASDDGGIAALMPDSIPPEQIARELGVGSVAVSPAVGRDAGSVWVLRLRPIRAGGVEIVPAHMPAARGALKLADTPAFGTGLHPTTALCLEALAESAQARPESVLDVGTGSGVLALAALVLGVPRATGLDVDPDALRAAAGNAQLNALDGRLELVRGGPEAIAGAWPLVLANVLAAPLVEMAPVLVRRVARHGELVLSGIASGIEPDVEAAYRRLGMRRTGVLSRAGWVALVLRASW
jgi:ribosomal protein L11 methyltransferase